MWGPGAAHHAALRALQHDGRDQVQAAGGVDASSFVHLTWSAMTRHQSLGHVWWQADVTPAPGPVGIDTWGTHGASVSSIPLPLSSSQTAMLHSQVPKAVVGLSSAISVQQVGVLRPHRAGLAPQAASWLVCRGRSRTAECPACSPAPCTGSMPPRRPGSASAPPAQTGTGPGASAWTARGTCSSRFDPTSEIPALRWNLCVPCLQGVRLPAGHGLGLHPAMHWRCSECLLPVLCCCCSLQGSPSTKHWDG